MFVNILLKFVLFLVLVPGVHLTIPGSLREKAALHAIIFAVANYFVYKFVRPILESFNNPKCPPGYKQCPSGDCVLESDVHGPCPGSSFSNE